VIERHRRVAHLRFPGDYPADFRSRLDEVGLCVATLS
jgi:hypothetical protein